MMELNTYDCFISNEKYEIILDRIRHLIMLKSNFSDVSFLKYTKI